MPTDPTMAVVLCSGGLDSYVAAAFAKRAGPTHLVWVHLGQRNAGRECAAAYVVADRLGCSIHRAEANIEPLLLAPTAHPNESPVRTLEEIRRDEKASPMVAPGRNAILISIGASYAQHLGAAEVHIGCNADDSAFPDCSPHFIGSMDAACYTGSGVRVRAPLITWPKWEIAAAAAALQLDVSRAWTGYRDGMKQCGVCDACVIRRDAFERAEETDPTEYARG